MANRNIVPSKLGDTSVNQKFVSSAFGISKNEIVFVIDTSVDNIVNDEYFLPLPECAFVGKSILDIKIQNDALGANTALSVGVVNFNKDYTTKTSGKFVVDSANFQDEKLVASYSTVSAQDTLVSKIKLSGGDYKFVDNDFLVIKNSGTASMTSGKIRIILELYSI